MHIRGPKQGVLVACLWGLTTSSQKVIIIADSWAKTHSSLLKNKMTGCSRRVWKKSSENNMSDVVRCQCGLADTSHFSSIPTFPQWPWFKLQGAAISKSSV